MTCTCKRCNQKRVIDCLFVKVDVSLHSARQTQLFVKVNSLSFGVMALAESCWEKQFRGILSSSPRVTLDEIFFHSFVYNMLSTVYMSVTVV